MLTNQHMIDCPCGSRIQERGFDRHLKTKKHQRFHDKMVAQRAAEKAQRARIAQEKADAKAAEDAAFAAECLKEPFPEFPDVLRNIIDDYAEPSEAAKAKMLRAIVYSREAHADYYRDDTMDADVMSLHRMMRRRFHWSVDATISWAPMIMSVITHAEDSINDRVIEW